MCTWPWRAAYLSREVETFRERERKHEEEEDRLREKVRALKGARDALQERLLSGAEVTPARHCSPRHRTPFIS